MKRGTKRAVIWSIVAIVAIAVIVLIAGGKKKAMQQISYETTAVERTDIAYYVTATGTIEPVTEVQVGTQVSGIIAKLYADYNSKVKAGQIIAEMDKVTLESDLASAQASYDGNEAEFNYQEKNLARSRGLHEKNLISDTEFEQAEYNYAMAKSAYENSDAALAKAKRNLSYATITSPIDGIVIDRAVEEGQTVAAGFETPTLFTIAADLTKMQVIADVDEADIGGVKEGQRVSFTVDAYPDDVFEGKVIQIRLGSSSSTSSVTTATTESVVTYEVVIAADNPDQKLLPRLTANLSIYTKEAHDVLCVPARALRFNPVATAAKGDKIIDCPGQTKVWTKEGNVFTAHPVTTGISDGVSTEITGGLDEGTEIIAGATFTGKESLAKKSGSPFAPGPPRH
ncbi:MAG: efflux RND transporter periplasmic adaptor subunit [Bacteroidetes bacterium]|uniref:Efflux RND transporter periplasmic adaptor subunit n=1 Tax=Candidatus Cryptobacteroides faecigallinarum TaxID=2840763 RepID=A0A9D9NI58_9BACT|nr:efflux RND transporter periplasmic adaptor subunit [Candidatus Cryptobacteroides faecigallinarum]